MALSLSCPLVQETPRNGTVRTTRVEATGLRSTAGAVDHAKDLLGSAGVAHRECISRQRVARYLPLRAQTRGHHDPLVHDAGVAQRVP